MGNHYHLLVETPEGNLVAGMKWLQGAYTQRYNGRHKVFGHLFQGVVRIGVRRIFRIEIVRQARQARAVRHQIDQRNFPFPFGHRHRVAQQLLYWLVQLDGMLFGHLRQQQAREHLADGTPRRADLFLALGVQFSYPAIIIACNVCCS